MKKLMVVAVALVIAASAMAQILPVAQTADSTEVGKIAATAAVKLYMGDADVTVFGARCSYGVMENLLILGDVGMCDVGDNEIGIGVAAQYTLAMLADKVPMDMAVRVGFGTWDIGELTDLGFIEGMVTASKKIEQVEGLAVYGGLGLDFFLNDDMPDSISFLADVGVTYAVPVEGLSVFGELGFASGNDMGLGIGAGAVYAF